MGSMGKYGKEWGDWEGMGDCGGKKIGVALWARPRTGASGWA